MINICIMLYSTRFCIEALYKDSYRNIDYKLYNTAHIHRFPHMRSHSNECSIRD